MGQCPPVHSDEEAGTTTLPRPAPYVTKLEFLVAKRGEERREEDGKRRERRSLSENWLPQKEKGWMEWEDEKGRGGGRKSKYAYSLGDGVA